MWSKLEKWFNDVERVHDIMRLGLGFTLLAIFDFCFPFAIGFILWSIFIVAQEIRDIIKWTRLGKFKKMWKDGIYDLAWGFSGVVLYSLLYNFSVMFLISYVFILLIIFALYDKKVRYKE